jgi:hypothetical protein
MAPHTLSPRRALTVGLLGLALLPGPPARADAGTPAPHGHSPTQYVATTTFVALFAVMVVALVQAVRAPTDDALKLQRAATAVDHALASALGHAASNDTRPRWATHPRSAAGAATGTAARARVEAQVLPTASSGPR